MNGPRKKQHNVVDGPTGSSRTINRNLNGTPASYGDTLWAVSMPTAEEVTRIAWKMRKVPEALTRQEMVLAACILAAHGKDAGTRDEVFPGPPRPEEPTPEPEPEPEEPPEEEPTMAEPKPRRSAPLEILDPLEVSEMLRGDYPQPNCPVCGVFARRAPDRSWELACLYWDRITRSYGHL